MLLYGKERAALATVRQKVLPSIMRANPNTAMNSVFQICVSVLTVGLLFTYSSVLCRMNMNHTWDAAQVAFLCLCLQTVSLGLHTQDCGSPVGGGAGGRTREGNGI